MTFKPEQDSIIGWILANQIRTESGKPFDLRSHPFFYDVLTDWSPKQVWLKAAQVGGSLAANLKLLYATNKYKINSIYTLPTATDRNDFVSGKTNMLITQNPVLQEMILDKDSVEQKRIGNNTVYFRGADTERAGLSITSDLNVHDEVDRYRYPALLEQYTSRQQFSKFKWEWFFSNPSTPGHGVDALWKRSDMKHWFIKCSYCQKEQFLSWPDSIDKETEQYVCKSCYKPLTEEARRKGRWIPIKYTVKPEYSGYWFNLMMAPWVTASEILKLYRTKSPEYFYNFVLGLPYAGAGNKLNEEEFFANLNDSLDKYDDPIVIGIDPGLPNWYVIGNKSGVFFHGHCDGWEEIHALMKRFPKSIAVCDQGGDLWGPRELRETFKGRVYLCWFRADRKTMRLVEWGKDKNQGAVIADRNRVIQQVIDELRTQRLPIYGNKEDWLECWQHFANMYKEIETDDQGQEKFVWKRQGPDHLALCVTYYRIGMTKFENDDGQRSTGGSLFPEIMGNVQIAPEIDYKGGMRLPPSGMEPQDWREID